MFMLSRLAMISSSRGFAVGPILVVVALIAIIGAAFMLSNRGSTSNTVNESAKVNSGLIAQQAVAMKSGIEKYLADGVDINNIELTLSPSVAGKVALFEPAKGYATPQQPPRLATSSTWSLASYTLPSVGTGSADVVLSLSGISKETCQRLLRSIHNIDPINLPSLFGTLAATTVTAGAGSPNATAMHEGCVATNATPAQNDYAYYSVIRPN